MEKLEIKTPCKINIGLKIVRKRSDGYHDIETVFYPINLFDTIIFEKSDSFSFDTNSTLIKTESSNSVITAVNKLEALTGNEFKVKIKLLKNIPIGAGLGGGSSDGAAALLGLNKLFNLGLTLNELEKAALDIGSDSPFFINPKPCFAESRGESLKPINFMIDYPILIVNPGIHVSTKWAYESIFLKSSINNSLNYQSLLSYDWDEIRNKIVNDFEEIVFQKYVEIKAIKDELYNSGALLSLMTGSGSTVFGIFLDNSAVMHAENKFSEKYFTFIHIP